MSSGETKNAAADMVSSDPTVIVTDDGFLPGDPNAPNMWLDLGPDAEPDSVSLEDAGAIRIAFPSFADGRGLTIAARLRARGFRGRLRAAGHVLADQYAMVRRAGFDDVEISADLARRQPEAQWMVRSNWRAHDYQGRLRG